MNWKHLVEQKIDTVIDKVANTLSQESGVPVGSRNVFSGMPELCRQAAAEGCVLLKNDGTLPLALEEPVAVFGRCQLDWFYTGYGSGGDLHPPYTVNLMEGLKNIGAKPDLSLAKEYADWCQSLDHKALSGFWGHWPDHHPEMPVSNETLRGVAGPCKKAIFVIGRASGEDQDVALAKGGFYLTDEEEALLKTLTTSFEHVVVVMNISGVMDFSWVEKYNPAAVLVAWHGGMESGNGVADVLYGNVSPCGKLTDTIARIYDYYPTTEGFGNKERTIYHEDIFLGYRYFDKDHEDQVLYPFGYGLSYTDFSVQPVGMAYNENSNKITLQVRVENTGNKEGKEVVALWCAPPKGRLAKPEKVLVGFAKTKTLVPSERQTILITANLDYMASYDELSHSFIYEPGEYRFVVNGEYYSSIYMRESQIQKKCTFACMPESSLEKRIENHLPQKINPTTDLGISFAKVAKGEASVEDFIAQLTPEELEALTRGYGGMNSPLGVQGNAGAIGGIIPALDKKGVPVATLTDGPSGVRLNRYCSMLPCGTTLASTWNLDLVTDLYETVGEEMRSVGSQVLLAPGMNLHRNPLCGRNFEYFSEDPLLSGFMGAAVVRGLQRKGIAACPKHFACNHQEKGRNNWSAEVSERALRELYLRNFEICVKEGQPWSIMTAYNKVNGVWSHYHYDMVQTILREEWGYDGVVMTDWWMKKAKCPEFPKLRDNAYRVRAGVDLLMPGNMSRVERDYKVDGSLLETLDKKDGLTLGEVQAAAKHTLEFLLKLTF